MENNYTEGGYVSDQPYVSPPVIHRSNSPPITLKDLNPRHSTKKHFFYVQLFGNSKQFIFNHTLQAS